MQDLDDLNLKYKITIPAEWELWHAKMQIY